MNGLSSGSINCIFTNLRACRSVAFGFSLEEGVDYVVTEKTANGVTYYRPCSYLYIKQYEEVFGYIEVPE